MEDSKPSLWDEIMKIPKKKLLIGIVIVISILILGLVLTLYMNFRVGDDIQKDTYIGLSVDFATTDNIADMVAASDMVVVGKYTGFEAAWNMSKSSDYTEGHLYRFEIEDVLKGSVSNEGILVNHAYSRTLNTVQSNEVVNDKGEIIKEATKFNEITFVVDDVSFIEPKIGATYILFLQWASNSYHYGAIEPFSIKFGDDNIAALQSNYIGRETDFHQEINVPGGSTIFVTTTAVNIADNISGLSFDEIKSEILSIA